MVLSANLAGTASLDDWSGPERALTEADNVGPCRLARPAAGSAGLLLWSEQRGASPLGETRLPVDLRGGMLALGKFDGVHVGHRSVIAETVSLARGHGVGAIVGTFDPHPACHFRRDVDPLQLTSLHQRARLCFEAGADAMVVFGFNSRLASVTPNAFVGEWLKDFGGVVTGADFGFGRGRSGDVSTLAALGAARDMICRAVPPVTLDGDIVSSSRIRQALHSGDCATATRLLGRRFTLEVSVHTSSASSEGGFLADMGPYLRPQPGSYLAHVEAGPGHGFAATILFPEPKGPDAPGQALVIPSAPRPKETHQSLSIALIRRLD